MWIRSFIALPAALLAAAGGSASADSVVWMGEVAGDNGWTAGFAAPTAGPTDLIGVRITSEGDSLENSALLNFSGPGWDTCGRYDEQPLLAGAAGPDFGSVGFAVHFAGGGVDPVALGLVLSGGEAAAGVIELPWDGAGSGIASFGRQYSLGRSDFEGVTLIPLPTAAALAGAGLFAAAPRRSRRR